MAIQHELDKMHFLFTDDTGQRADALIISSHGGYHPLTSSVTVPMWSRVSFFNPHGTVLIDPELGNVMDGQINLHATFGPGTPCQNYTLEKFQGDRGNISETYDSVKEQIDRNRKRPDYIKGLQRQGGLLKQKGDALDKIKHLGFDVLTVRHRAFQRFSSLKEVLELLDEKGRKYPDIYCKFCRSSILGGSPDFNPPCVNTA